MAGRFLGFHPISACCFLRGGKVLMKKREWKGKEEVIKTKNSVKGTPTGARNKALQSAFIRETARNARQKSGSVFNETAEDAQEDMEDTAVYIPEYAVRKAKNRKSDKKDIPEKKGGQPKGRRCGQGMIYREREIPLIKPPREEQ